MRLTSLRTRRLSYLVSSGAKRMNDEMVSCRSHQNVMEAEALLDGSRHGEDKIEHPQSRAHSRFEVAALSSTVLLLSTVREMMYKAGESEVPVNWVRLESPRQQRALTTSIIITAPPSCHTQTPTFHLALSLLIATDFYRLPPLGERPLDLSPNLQTSDSQWHWTGKSVSMLHAELQRKMHMSEMQRFSAYLWSCRTWSWNTFRPSPTRRMYALPARHCRLS